MVCEECKGCWNYMVCENGCYGSSEPCEHLVNSIVTIYPRAGKTAYTETLKDFAKSLKALKEPINKAKSIIKELTEAVADNTATVDPSRRRFEAVACKKKKRGRY